MCKRETRHSKVSKWMLSVYKNWTNNQTWFIGWFYKTNMFFVDRKCLKVTRGTMVSKRCCLFLIIFSETIGPIGTKLGRNVH